MSDAKWIVSPVPDKEAIEKVAKKNNVSRLIAAILCVRGFTFSEAEDYINTDAQRLLDPFLLKDMEKAVKRINTAISDNEKIAVYGDYDVDGVTATTLMLSCLKELGADASFYIPSRDKEGYGINKESVEMIASHGVSLIITVDCGITAIDECEYAKSLGVDLIITDHHECTDKVPDAVATINAKQHDCKYPFKDLAGVGVAFKLAQALLGEKYSNEEILDKYSQFVTIGSIADIVPVLGENRIICKHGLKKLSETKTPGINALFNVSGVEKSEIDSFKIGFAIAPRINAAGRIGGADKAVELFLTKDINVADKIAKELDDSNTIRQKIEAEIFKEAEDQLLSKFSDNKIAVLSDTKWHHGVVGIVSSRLAKKYMRPCILISEGPDGNYKGSGRSIEGFSLYSALDASKDTLISFGGHELAAGIVIARDKIDDFRNKINKYAENNFNEELTCRKFVADLELRERHLNIDVAKELSVLQPFGTNNNQPVFYIEKLLVLKVNRIGSAKQHLRLTLKKGNVIIDAIAFGFGEYNVSFNDTINVMCNLDINTFRNIKTVQLKILDIK
ncbi:MAG: single-stranded-DNA-specific exonuclease RecJ [Clostridia bacterium]|nr:single-stranded-DNA-specific exonuclease RecJ [Clostridia bacterium]